jgi:hypothetical protein
MVHIFWWRIRWEEEKKKWRSGVVWLLSLYHRRPTFCCSCSVGVSQNYLQRKTLCSTWLVPPLAPLLFTAYAHASSPTIFYHLPVTTSIVMVYSFRHKQKRKKKGGTAVSQKTTPRTKKNPTHFFFRRGHFSPFTAFGRNHLNCYCQIYMALFTIYCFTIMYLLDFTFCISPIPPPQPSIHMPTLYYFFLRWMMGGVVQLSFSFVFFFSRKEKANPLTHQLLQKKKNSGMLIINPINTKIYR